jgi:hypothetical protein
MKCTLAAANSSAAPPTAERMSGSNAAIPIRPCAARASAASPDTINARLAAYKARDTLRGAVGQVKPFETRTSWTRRSVGGQLVGIETLAEVDAARREMCAQQLVVLPDRVRPVADQAENQEARRGQLGPYLRTRIR